MAGLFYLTGCKALSQLSALDFVAWVENPDNGLRESKTLDGICFDLQYKPAEYVVLRENLVIPGSAAEMNNETSLLSDMQYFTLRISREDGRDLLQDEPNGMDQFSARLVYFSGAMQHDIKLIDGNDTLPCQLFHFERTFGVDTRSTFLVGFQSRSTDELNDKTFVFEDHELGVGPVMITIEKESIQNIPLLKLN